MQLVAVLVCALSLIAGTSHAGNGEDPQDTVTSLLGLRTSTLSALFVAPVSSDTQLGIATFLDDESRCDGAPGCVESIDTLYEAYSLASYLFLYWNDRLRRPIREADLARHRALQNPPSAEKEPAIERLQAEDRGDLLRRNAEEFRESFWSSHLQTNRDHILSSLQRFANLRAKPESRHPPTLMILGAGSCADIPLEELAEDFEVVLVDIDLPSMQIARARLPKALQARVRLEVRDLSGGVALRHSGEFERIITTSQGSAEAMDRLARFMETAVIPTPLLEGEHRVDALVSSMLVSQIPFYLVMHIVEELADPSIGMEGQGWSRRFEAAYRRYASRIDAAHAEALRDFCVRSSGFVYYSSDLYLKRSALEFQTVEDIVPNLNGARIQSLWHGDTPVMDLSEVFQSDQAIEIIASFDTWIWEHLHPALQARWSPERLEHLCAPLREDSCWAAGPQRFKYGRRFYVDAVSFTRR